MSWVKNVKFWHAIESGNFLQHCTLNFKEFGAQVVQESDLHIYVYSLLVLTSVKGSQ